jgi:hypothetical protein
MLSSVKQCEVIQSNANASEEADAAGGEEGVMMVKRRRSRGRREEKKKGESGVRARASVIGPCIKPYH